MNKIEKTLNSAVNKFLTLDPVFDRPVQTACLVAGASLTGFGVPVMGAYALLSGAQNMMKAIGIVIPFRQDLSSRIGAGVIGTLGLTCAALSFCLTTDTTLSFSTQVAVTVLATAILNKTVPVDEYVTLATGNVDRKISLKTIYHFKTEQLLPLVHISIGIGPQILDNLVAKHLLWRGALPCEDSVCNAIWKGNLLLLRLLVKHGADCNKGKYFSDPGLLRITPLICAYDMKNFNMVNFLIDSNANVHAIDNIGLNGLTHIWLANAPEGEGRYKVSYELSNEALKISTLLLKKGLEPSADLKKYPLFQQFFNQFQASEFRKSKPLFKAELDIFNELNLMNHLHAFHSTLTPVASSDGAFLEEIED